MARTVPPRQNRQLRLKRSYRHWNHRQPSLDLPSRHHKMGIILQQLLSNYPASVRPSPSKGRQIQLLNVRFSAAPMRGVGMQPAYNLIARSPSMESASRWRRAQFPRCVSCLACGGPRLRCCAHFDAGVSDWRTCGAAGDGEAESDAERASGMVGWVGQVHEGECVGDQRGLPYKLTHGDIRNNNHI